MLDEEAAQWRSVDAVAASLASTAIAAGRQQSSEWTATLAQAADVLSLVLYAIVDQDNRAPEAVGAAALRQKLVLVAGTSRWLDAALAGTQRADWQTYLRRHDPLVTARGACEHAVHVISAAMLATTRGLRLLDRVLAPLHGRDGLYPGRLVEVSVDKRPDRDDVDFTIRVRMDRHRDDYNFCDAGQVLLDIDPAATDHRSTHAHAVRCVVADLRRTADGLVRSQAEAHAAITDLLARVALYATYEDLHLELVGISTTVLAATAPPRRRALWRRPAPFTEQVLAAVGRGANQIHALPLAESQRQSAFLITRAHRLEAMNL
ncbi:hypothetical protein [Micromonospora sp. NPDC050695]|uniref:hypothetical protein n=1 Tax=Micromonospora sp. NPDC050695 TaxID=3154938 RepID=UPI00340B44AC